MEQIFDRDTGSSMAAIDDERIAAALLRYLSARHLSARLGGRDLAYAVKPARVGGGLSDTSIFGFSLHGVGFAGPLILRLGQPTADPARFVLEYAVQNALAAMGFPAPEVHVIEKDKAALGGPFLIMRRLAGRPLAHEVERLNEAGSPLGKLRGLLGLPLLFGEITARWVEVQLQLHGLPVEPVLNAVEHAGLNQRILTFEGQRERLAGAIESAGLAALTPGLDWLEANNPGPPQRTVICHGDFHPLNIMTDAGRVTGVIDWANVVVAAPEMDVGSAIATIATVPFKVPPQLRPLLRGVIGSALWTYLRAYRRRQPIDDYALRYFQVFRAFAQLASAALALQAGRPGGAYGSEAGVRNLTTFIDRRAGLKIRL